METSEFAGIPAIRPSISAATTDRRIANGSACRISCGGMEQVMHRCSNLHMGEKVKQLG
ncbi:hypothetical protein SAMN05660991_00810 [Trujillonella endophytica]|uniref:Uncharacterized protein n=1 Tax=Trujillonella endophytica TaxID=673521 RepID=A0A1H8QV78_9ACTN|nr:hypothetical protein SAMN05660991_00810 [Trujillella endophytica]